MQKSEKTSYSKLEASTFLEIAFSISFNKINNNYFKIDLIILTIIRSWKLVLFSMLRAISTDFLILSAKLY